MWFKKNNKMKKNVLAIIPARANSKGIINKNIQLINGKPLIQLTIEFVKSLKFVDKIVVSTDSKKIIDIANKFAVTTVLRPAKLATDQSKVEDAISHVIKNFDKNFNYDYILLFEPTSPLRTTKTVNECFKILTSTTHFSVFTVSRSNKFFGYVSNSKFYPLIKSQKRRRQDRKSLFFECGVFYGIKYETFLKKKRIIDKTSYCFEIGEIESIDINNIDDLKIVKSLLME